MTSIQSKKFKCSKCGITFEKIIYDSVNIDLNPNLIEDVKQRKINTIKCPKCGFGSELACKFLYHNQGRSKMIWCCPENERNLKESLEKKLEKAKYLIGSPLSFVERKVGVKYDFRVVLGYDELLDVLSDFEVPDYGEKLLSDKKIEENERKALEILYREYPDLAPENDPNNELFNQFLQEYRKRAKAEKDIPKTVTDMITLGREVINWLKESSNKRINYISKKYRNRDIKWWLRWIAIPFSAIGAYLGSMLIFTLSNYIEAFFYESLVPIMLVKIVNSAIGPYFFVIAGAKTAPSHRFIVGIILTIVHTLFIGSAVTLWFIVYKSDIIIVEGRPLWQYILFGFLGVTATIIACVQLKRKNS